MIFSIRTINDVLIRIPQKFNPRLLKFSCGEYFLENEHESMIPCSKLKEDHSFEMLIGEFKKFSTVVVLNQKNEPVGVLTCQQMLYFLYCLYQQLTAFYQTVLLTTDASVTVVDRDERVLSWTKGAEKIFSVKHEDIIGMPITTFFNRNNLEILQSLKKGKNLIAHYHQPRSDLFVLINSNPVYFNDQIIGAVVSETDITHQVILNEKLFNMSNEVHRLEKEVARYKSSPDPFHAVKGKSIAITKTIQLAKKLCSVKSSVLILGESGVGKEVFAKAIHEASSGSRTPFLSINCGAIPASLFESELFGYERGAFSGADQKGKKGKIEMAKGGTLFLDEIGEMPLEMQVKLLRVLQEKKYYRVGGEKEVNIDFRVIAATNRNLQDLMAQGKFREDLYYRLNVVTLNIPPLRGRHEDIIELTNSFIDEFSLAYERPIYEFSPEVLHEMLQYHWPGNIRELRNVSERLVVFATDGLIKKEYLPSLKSSTPSKTKELLSDALPEADDVILPLKEEMERHEKMILKKALNLVNGNKAECAKLLGITRATLYNRLKRLCLELPPSL
ncbi:sigma-54 interaction domain-containing protein [Mesobacillus zeae]|uniref:PAS domain-containing protein n=1 Tax=Mesobacillus zeae TaxID=1917180 RepID=A0A398AXC8_9BACI|nr:sigma 54-interacting transcriptional regulator [Mesobacillus zeae]RID81694.1 PAS domain-containing protein [Mesobacillus zeae]